MKTIKLFFKSLPFLAVLVLGSCMKQTNEDTGSLNIRFKLVYGEQPLEMFKEYNYPVSNNRFVMTRLSFFISDIKLKATGKDIRIKDIDYLNLTAAHTAPLAVNGFEYQVKDIPVGVYSNLDFSIGVPSVDNAKSPKDFESESVLSGTAEYWSAWKSYIFFRPEGQISLDGKPLNEGSFALHLGADDAFRSFSLPRAVEIKNNTTTNVDVYIDINKFFNGNTWYDINATQQIHSLSQLPLIRQLADNLATAVR